MKTYIIIPYRDRKTHLDYYLANTKPLLDKYFKDSYEIVIVEQNEGKKFNRGATLNIGFQICSDEDCYIITQDVDVNPPEKVIKELYLKELNENSVMGIYTSQSDTLGGIIKSRRSTFYKVNGFPNNFWGWGSEDKALQIRAEKGKLNITKNYLNNGMGKKVFKVFDHPRVIGGNGNSVGKIRREKDPKKGSGLNCLNFKILSETRDGKIRRVIVNILPDSKVKKED